MGHILGIELGSTRIKAVLIDDEGHNPVASGTHDWENRLEDGYWTYHLDDAWTGIRDAFANLMDDAGQNGLVPDIRAMGVSAMMHGYLVFGADGAQLAPFRTWRNTTTEKAAEELSRSFGFNIPQRWSVAHIYQAIMDGEPHVKDVAILTTLAGYIHGKLTGRWVAGVGETSGMFPIDAATRDYDDRMLAIFDKMAKGACQDLRKILPQVLYAGEDAGSLTEEGARLLDPSGRLAAGIPLCPPEGDAGTGMVATNSVSECTGNVSAGTSIFAMIVMNKELSRVYPEIDIIATPAGKSVAMVHANNCTCELDAWVRLFGELLAEAGAPVEKDALYKLLYNSALRGDADGGGLVCYNFLSGEAVVGLRAGCPMTARLPDSRFTLANFMRTQIFTAMAVLKMGMDLLTEQEGITVDMLIGHGGLFKTEGVGQPLLAGALNIPVSVMATAGEGGAWGIALLAAYALRKQEGETLEAYLAQRVFAGADIRGAIPDPRDIQGFAGYYARFLSGLPAAGAVAEHLR
ncbi:MAG: FGGY-family carbohydrate kinase [Oscillospiraceae bacterium]|nr:FGGY-family carbohydrate kinase [Oscillospiraceae bacterium]